MTLELTKEQIAKIKQDMSLQTEMLTDEEVNALATKVNEKFSLPLLSEEKEFIVFAKIIKWIDRQLYALLPNEYYELIHNAHDGLSPEEVIKIRTRVTPLINSLVDIPVLTEGIEELVIGFVVDAILTAMTKGLKIDQRPLKA